MMPRKILVIDDVKSLRKAIEKVLSLNGFSALTAANGSDGLILAQEVRPDLVLTDADLPGLDGHALCRALKRGETTRHIPVIIMSGALIEEKDVVAGLDGGADDYVVKPLSMNLLLARVRVALRRHEMGPHAGRSVNHCGLRLDPAAREVLVQGAVVPLTRKEFDLLAVLLQNAGRVLTSNYLLEWVWGYDPAEYNDPHTVETHISHLRKKLGSKISRHIINVRGCGYKFQR